MSEWVKCPACGTRMGNLAERGEGGMWQAYTDPTGLTLHRCKTHGTIARRPNGVFVVPTWRKA